MREFAGTSVASFVSLAAVFILNLAVAVYYAATNMTYKEAIGENLSKSVKWLY